MNEIRTLMEKFWICRDSDKETFYKVKRDIPNFQRFIREQLGWKLIHTEKLLKLEKRPAHAEAFMGINEFTDIRDYCILCVVLMYLEDAEEGKQFLLSELIDYVETQLKNYMPVDWTSFTQRKSLVRVLQYMERLQMLRVYEGKVNPSARKPGRKYCMKIQAIRNILPAALLPTFPDMNPGRILKRQILRNLRKTEDHGVLTGYTGSWQSARHFTGTVQRTLMHYT